MSFSKNIQHYLEKRVELCAEVNPSVLNHRAWIRLVSVYEGKGYIFMWTEIPQSTYDIILGEDKDQFEPYDFYKAKNFLCKYIVDEDELEKMVIQYLDDLSALKPSWHYPYYPFY